MIGIGFIYTFISNKKKGSTFGQKVWWHYLRPIHAILYLLFGYMAINKSNFAYIPLLIDLIIGILSFLIYHTINGSFRHLKI